MEFVILPVGATILSLALTFIYIQLGKLFKYYAPEDPFHSSPVILSGGITIWLTFMTTIFIFTELNNIQYAVLLCSSALFIIGLYDDIFELKPLTKLILQIIVASILIWLGLRIEIIPYPAISIPLTIFWIIGITNAFNLIDNMDGLAGGIGAIASILIGLFFLVNGDQSMSLMCFILAGAVLGFLYFNFKAAKVFMGDCGSMFLGFFLSAITVAGAWQKTTNVFTALAIPIIILGILIFNMVFVSYTRTSNGISIIRGTADHISYRLTALGMSRSTAVLALYAITAITGGLSILFGQINVWLLPVLIVLSFVSFYFFGIYLGKIDIYDKSPNLKSQINEKEKSETYRKIGIGAKKTLEVIIDIILISVSYFSAYLIRFEGSISADTLTLFVNTLPLIIMIKLIALYIFGSYKAIWKYVSIKEIMDITKAVTLSFLLAIVTITFIYRFIGYSRAVFVIDLFLSLFLISGSRVFIRILNEIFIPLVNKEGKKILIYGAGDAGHMLLNEIKNNKKLNYYAIGFLDDDLNKQGSTISGLPVLGSRADIPSIIKNYEIEEIIIAIFSIDEKELDKIIEICNNSGITTLVTSRIMQLGKAIP